jgi:hypothetical protein
VNLDFAYGPQFHGPALGIANNLDSLRAKGGTLLLQNGNCKNAGYGHVLRNCRSKVAKTPAKTAALMQHGLASSNQSIGHLRVSFGGVFL